MASARRIALSICLGIAGVVIAVPVARRAYDEVVRPGWNGGQQFTLPNGWRLTPAGQSIKLPGDMPGNIVLLDGGRRALINTCGFHDHSVSLVDLASGKVVQSIPFQHAWVGLSASPDGNSAYISGGQVGSNHKYDAIHRVLIGTELTSQSGFALPGIGSKEQYVSGLLAEPSSLYVANIQSDEVLKLALTGDELARAKVGYRPYALALSQDRSTIAVSNWGDKSVSLLAASDLKLLSKVAVGPLPSALAYDRYGRLFVAESGSNTVCVIDQNEVVERIKTGIDPSNPVGASPVALVVSPNSERLYVANAGNNCVTVIDISTKGHAKVKGLIPTERYPTALAVTPDNRRLLIATAKGYYGPNGGAAVDASLPGTRTEGQGARYRYIGDQLERRLAILNVPDEAQLQRYTRQCLANQPRGVAAVTAAERRSVQRGAFSKIKHVIYVIKENRTYDQVLGDVGKGESDPSLTLFGKRVTPNIHRIVGEFALLDNLYTDGEVSQVGHQWTDAAYASDYTEKQWILSYSRHGEVESDPRMTASPGEYLWTQARKHGLTTRVFGEYVSVQEDHTALTNPEVKKDPEKYGFSAPFEAIFARGGRDTEKVAEFIQEMKEAEKTGRWPNVMVMALPEDHTRGMSGGSLSPYAMVGSNDLAVGQLVDAVSHSSFWKDTAIFVIEDDAQNGPDHVDSHRTEGLVVSPYVKRGIIDSTMYSTSSMLRTMELMLGLPPMSQYDAKATPMYRSFTDRPNFAPYALVKPEVDLEERNPSETILAKRSAKLDFSDIDRADETEFNHILWKAYRPSEPYPVAVPKR